MKKCSDCIYYEPVKTIKNIGVCTPILPYWVEEDSYYVPSYAEGTADLCNMYTPHKDEELPRGYGLDYEDN